MTKTERLLLAATVLFLAALFLFPWKPGLRARAAQDAYQAPEPPAGPDGEDGAVWIILQTAVDLNTATEEELMLLPGIGETLAGRIVEYRQEHGPFSSVDDLLAIPGIGEGVVDRILAASVPPEES